MNQLAEAKEEEERREERERVLRQETEEAEALDDVYAHLAWEGDDENELVEAEVFLGT